MLQVKQSSAVVHFLFLMVDSTDHVTGKTGLTPTVTISKNAAAFASPAGAITEVSGGWYKLAANATDSNTLGVLALHATGTAADPTDMILCNIVAMDVQDSVRLGLTALPNAAAEAAGGLFTRGSGAGQINQANNGQVDANAARLGGTTQTGRDVGTSVLLSSGTGTGQLDFTSGVVKANLAQILGTALTETAGLLAAGFKKWFNVASPTGTLNSIPDAVPDASGGLPVTGNRLTAIPTVALVTTTTNLTNAPPDSAGTTTLLTRLSAARAGYLDNLSAGAVALASKLTKYTQLLARKDAAIATDNATEVTEINANGGSGGGAYANTTDAQEALRDRGDAAWITATGFAIAGDAMTLTSGERTTLAGVIWDRLTSAITTVGSIGKLIKDDLDATVSSRSSHSAADVWAVATRLLTAGTNIVLAKGVGVTGFNDLSAAAVNSEVDTALADYDAPTHAELVSEINDVQADIAAIPAAPSVAAVADGVWDEAIGGHLGAGSTGEALSNAGAAGTPPTVVQIRQEMDSNSTKLARVDVVLSTRASQTSVDDLPTNAELATALAAADDAVLAAIAALNNLSAAQVLTQATSALNTYDAPTKAEMDAGLALLATAANLAVAAGNVVGIKAKTDNLPADPSSASTIAASFVTVNATLATIVGFLDTEIAAILARTNLIPNSPAAVGDIPSATTIADVVLGRDFSAVASYADRSLLQALRMIRNRTDIVAGLLTVYLENDTDPAWTGSVSQAPGDPIVAVDPT